MSKNFKNLSGVVIGNNSQAISANNINGSINQTNRNNSDNLENTSIQSFFTDIHKEIINLPDSPQKLGGLQAITGLQDEAEKGEFANEVKTEGFLYILLQMLPDIGEVALKTFINPINGFSTVFQKIAEKIKSERKK